MTLAGGLGSTNGYSASDIPNTPTGFSADVLHIPNQGGSETRPKNVYVNYIIKY